MSSVYNQVVVPPGLLQAVRDAIDNQPKNLIPPLEWGLQAAVRWLLWNVLTDNPTSIEFDQIHNSKWCLYGEGERCRAASEGMRMLLASKRRFFLAGDPPNPVVTTIRQTVMGATLTADESRELVELIQRATKPEAP